MKITTLKMLLLLLLIFIYLASCSPNCSTQDLCCIMQDLLLWRTNSSCGTWAPEVMECRLSCSGACGILISWPGINPHPNPWTEESGSLQFMGSQRIVHNYQFTSFSFFKFIFSWMLIALQCCVGFCHTPV